MVKTMKILSIILTIAMIFTISMGTISMATGAAGDQSSDSTIDDLFTPNGDLDTDNLTNVGANIVSIITTIGIVVAVVVLLVLGIKYMMGSASEKAEYKKTMIPYLVGAVLIFGASAIAKAVVSVSEAITSTGTGA